MPLACMPPTPMLVQTAVAAATVECEFTGQLMSLMAHMTADHEEQPARPVEQKKTDHPLAPSVVMAFFASMLPAPIPAAFGLPSAGDEKGPAQVNDNTKA